MKLEPIAMEKTEAKRAFIEYRNAVRARHSKEDAEIMRGYKALAKGLQLIKLSEAVKAGGIVRTTLRGGEVVTLPRIAVVRASASTCWCSVGADGSVRFAEERWPNHRAVHSVRKFAAGTLEGTVWSNGSAIVPTIPPRFRPDDALSNYHLLFEAEWQPVAPTDPALLKHIGGDLYAVLAIWDLTEIERAVLQQRIGV